MKTSKTGHAIFISFFSDASERRVWLSAESKIHASTFGRFRMYRLSIKIIIKWPKQAMRTQNSNTDSCLAFFQENSKFTKNEENELANRFCLKILSADSSRKITKQKICVSKSRSCFMRWSWKNIEKSWTSNSKAWQDCNGDVIPTPVLARKVCEIKNRKLRKLGFQQKNFYKFELQRWRMVSL